jgi:hypothetical protein
LGNALLSARQNGGSDDTYGSADGLGRMEGTDIRHDETQLEQQYTENQQEGPDRDRVSQLEEKPWAWEWIAVVHLAHRVQPFPESTS